MAWSSSVDLHEAARSQIQVRFDLLVMMVSIVVVVVVVAVGWMIAVWVDLDLDRLSFEQADTVAAAVVCLAVVVVVVDAVGYTSSLVVDHKIADHTYAAQPLAVLVQDTSFARVDRSFPSVVAHQHHPLEHSQDPLHTCSVVVVVASVVHHDDHHGVLIAFQAVQTQHGDPLHSCCY